MPGRFVRDYRDSAKLASVSEGAEALFVRIMLSSDDFGLFRSHPMIVAAACYPMGRQGKMVDADQVAAWLDELEAAGLIRRTEPGPKQVGQIIRFGQRIYGHSRPWVDNAPADWIEEARRWRTALAEKAVRVRGGESVQDSAATPAGLPQDSGRTPGELREDSGRTPAGLPQNSRHITNNKRHKTYIPPPTPPIAVGDSTAAAGGDDLIEIIRTARPEYGRLNPAAIASALAACPAEKRAALRAAVERWAEDQANALEPMRMPLASIRKLVERLGGGGNGAGDTGNQPASLPEWAAVWAATFGRRIDQDIAMAMDSELKAQGLANDDVEYAIRRYSVIHANQIHRTPTAGDLYAIWWEEVGRRKHVQ